MEQLLLQLGLTPVGRKFCPPSEHYLQAIEALIGAALPPAYRSFLARFGACILGDSVACCLPDNSWIDVHLFLGNDPDDSYELTQNYLQLQEHQLDHLLPVAMCPMGNAFCLSLSASFGCVRYVEMGGHSTYLVAASFDAFIAGLRRLT